MGDTRELSSLLCWVACAVPEPSVGLFREAGEGEVGRGREIGGSNRAMKGSLATSIRPCTVK